MFVVFRVFQVERRICDLAIKFEVVLKFTQKEKKEKETERQNHVDFTVAF